MRPRSADPAIERGRRVLFGGLAVGLVIAVAAAVVWLRTSGSHGRGSRPATVLAGAIAWVNRPAPETQAPPLPRPVFPSGPRCGPSALRFIGTQGGGATGNAVYRVTLRNVSSHPCEVRGYPRVLAVGADGSVRTLQVRHGSFFRTPGPVAAAAPGQVVGVNLDGSGACTRRADFDLIRLVLPSGGHVDVRAPFFAGCGILGVSRFGVLSLDRAVRQSQISLLVVSTVAPKTVMESSTMRYTVSITNNGDTAYPLRPCPSYQEVLVVIVRGAGLVSPHPTYFFLNCDAVPAIPAHGTVLFAMEMRVPGAVGPAKFGWILNVPGSPAAGTMVQVEPTPPPSS